VGIKLRKNARVLLGATAKTASVDRSAALKEENAKRRTLRGEERSESMKQTRAVATVDAQATMAHRPKSENAWQAPNPCARDGANLFSKANLCSVRMLVASSERA
jgi:hypothetical protein